MRDLERRDRWVLGVCGGKVVSDRCVTLKSNLPSCSCPIWLKNAPTGCCRVSHEYEPSRRSNWTHDETLPSLKTTTPRVLPLNELAGLELVRAHLVDTAVLVAAVTRRRRGPEGELGHDLVLAGLEVGDHPVQVLLKALCSVRE